MLESKKYDLIKWIIAVADEKVIDVLQAVKEKLELSKSEEINDFSYTTSSFAGLSARKIDLEALKVSQNYQPTSTDELSAIAKEAAIEQSIEFLLQDLKSID